VARDRVNRRIKDVEDRAALVEREALEWVSRVKTENSIAPSFARADAEGLVWKIVLLEDEIAEEHSAWETAEKEDQGHFKELPLLQT
jgi:hypothetical protein